MELKELREKSLADLKTTENELRRELFDLEFKHGTRQLMDTASIGRMKKDIARVMTVMTEKSGEAAAQ